MEQKPKRNADGSNYADFIDEILREAYESRWFRNKRLAEANEAPTDPLPDRVLPRRESDRG